MALVLADRVKETTTTAGTGTVTLLGASAGFQSFAVIGNANTTYYTIAAQTGTEWEVGIGTYTLSGTTLARTTVLSNSLGTQPTALTFSAGTKDVFVTYPSSKSVNLDASGNATALGTPAAFVGTNITGTASGLTAGNVTTNANLAGDVTSVGNTTSIAAGVIVNADINASAGIVDTKLATISTALKVSNSATTATNANTASAIVARDASGNFSAGTITASLSGNATTATTATTANATATGNNFQMANLGVGIAPNGVNGDITAARSGGGTGVIFFGNSGTRYLFYDGTTYQLNTASLVVGGNVTAFSDERVKTNWRDLQPDFIERLAEVKHGIYDRTDQELTQIGVGAQSLRPLMEHAILENEDGELSVSYGNAALVACIKLAQRVVDLEAKLEQLIKDKS